MSRISVIIPAAGSSKRMNPGPPRRRGVKGFPRRKPFILLGGKPILAYAVDVFRKIDGVEEIILVVNRKDLKAARRYFSAAGTKIIEGAASRSGSVRNGLKAVDKECNLILIHDGARPFVDRDVIARSIYAANKFGAAVSAVPVVSTIKTIDKNGFVVSTLDRKRLWEIQTPQAFRKDIILAAFGRLKGIHNENITDDAMLVERTGRSVKIVMGSYQNIKITAPHDLKIAKALLEGKT